MDLAIYCTIMCLVELMVRGIWPYLQAPWAWAKVVDPRISVSEKTRLIQSLLSSAPCCTDFGFTLRLQSAADNQVEEFLPNGRFYSAIELLSCHRTINVAIEDCFARATGQAQASRRPSLNEPNAHKLAFQFVSSLQIRTHAMLFSAF